MGAGAPPICLPRTFGHHGADVCGRYRNECWSLLLWIAWDLFYSPSSLLSCISSRLCISFVSARLSCISGNRFVSLSVLLWIRLVHKSNGQRTLKSLRFAFCLSFIPPFLLSPCFGGLRPTWTLREMWLGRQRRCSGCREDGEADIKTRKAGQVNQAGRRRSCLGGQCDTDNGFYCVLCVRVLIKSEILTFGCIFQTRFEQWYW